MSLLGLSTGCFYENSPSLRERMYMCIDASKILDLHAMEVNLGDLEKTQGEQNDLLNLCERLSRNKQFSYRSLHLPIIYDEQNPNPTKIIPFVSKIINSGNFDTLVVHSNFPHQWSMFDGLHCTLGIENISDFQRSPDGSFGDKRSAILNTLIELLNKNLQSRNLLGKKPEGTRIPKMGIVLDTEHFWEGRNRMSMPNNNWLDIIKKHLLHAHISGYNSSDKEGFLKGKHVPYSYLPNPNEQLKSLQVIPTNKPIILESIFPRMGPEQILEAIGEELDLISRHI